jgi:N-acyl-D-amino-acid deacylase
VQFDILIKNASLIDGSGEPGRVQDLAVAGDSIKAIGDLGACEAAEMLDATGLCLCPGFIDIHAHSEFNVLIDAGRSKVMQGITTEVCGNCGLSAAPLLGMAREQRRAALAGFGLDPDWTTMPQYFERLERTPLRTNIALLAGHGNVRGSVIGYGPEQATPQQLADMGALLEEAMECGCWGLSSGLIYPPGAFAPVDELVHLATILKKFGGFYATHMRSESDQLIEAVIEALEVGRRAGIPVQISHLKTMDRRNWHKLPQVLELIEQARGDGLDITSDRYPYCASSTGLDAHLPLWACAGGNAAELERLRDPVQRTRMCAELFERAPEEEIGQTTLLARISGEANAHLQGRTLIEAAALRGQSVGDALCDLLIEEQLDIDAVFFCMNEDNLRTILKQAWVMAASDAAARDTDGALGRDMPHPRAFGTCARFLEMARDEKLMPAQEAVRKMTGLPAQRMGFRDRGFLKPGFRADLVLFDPVSMRDTATYAEPHRYPAGIHAVMVNGVWTVKHGECTQSLAGRLLQRNQ